ncbi:MAG: carboxypeptidase regulatory-like domain-containing protein [Pyrinomonadaceae bacterium]
MKIRLATLIAAFAVLIVANLCLFGQTAGSIAGNITDSNSAVIAGAKVTVVGPSGVDYTVVTSDVGNYRIPALGAGLYKVTVVAANFKTSVVENVKVDVGTPTTVNVSLEAGVVSETVVITSGGEVLQTQTAAVGTNITGRQITETPIASRDALDLIGLLPGTATVGRPRSASINGLPKGSLSITIDGVDVQDNLLRSSDGYFTYVRPRVDAIEEVNVSTSNPGSESGGDGAVQIKFVTKRGKNDYTGSAFFQHRNEALNANYWYLNRDGQRDANGKAERQLIRLNQYGASFGGPIPFPRFGDGGGKFLDNGKDKRFFFVNYEEFRLPQTQSRTRTILSPEAEQGFYQYIAGGVTRQANVLQIAQTAACSTCTFTPDPTIAAVLARIRTAVGTTGTISPIPTTPGLFLYNFSPSGDSTRKFLAVRLDFNLTKNHSLEFVTNQQEFVPSKDFLNSQDERFPGFPSYTQGSVRDSYSTALRSTFGQNVVNEARYAFSTGLSTFSDGISAADYDYLGGRVLAIEAAIPAGIAGVSNGSPVSRNSYSDRNTPTFDFTDSVTWNAGNHSINFGGEYKLIRREGSSIGRIVPTVSFGIDSSDSAFGIFNSTSVSGASPAQLTAARNLYAVLIGRVSAYTTTAFLNPDGTYRENDTLVVEAKQNTYGLFAQDSWRIRPNFTVNFGLRWQPQTAFVAVSENTYTRLESFDQVYGVSGLGNIFKPGTLTGTDPRVVPLLPGEKAYPNDFNNFAPSFGFVWSPNFNNPGFLRGLFGGEGKSVFRGGYSVAFVREGFNLLESIYGSNPGGSQSLSRTIGNGLITVGTNLRDANNPNLTPRPNIIGTSPSFPIALTSGVSTNTFSPDLKTGSVASFSFGYQRELDKNTVIEFRYVGNRGKDLQRQYDINEFNTIESGFAAEFGLAQANLIANEAAFAAGDTLRRYCSGFFVNGQCRATNSATGTVINRVPTYAYFGAATGTSPLPILLAYFNTVANYDPLNPARYGGSGGSTAVNAFGGNFGNTTLITALSPNAPNVFGFNGTSFEASAARRANAIANGLPSNFFYVNPLSNTGGSFIVDNSNLTWYDSGVIELRRRLSNGLRFQASYVFSKAQANAYASSSVVFAGFTQRPGGLDLAKNVQAFDLRHQFKVDATWDLPFGRGRSFLSGSNGLIDALVGGWSILPTLRWQSGSPFAFGNVQLVGLTVKELQKAIKIRKGPTAVFFLPDDIILNTQKAFNIDVSNTANGGYGTTFGTGGPQGRFIAPAGFGNCISRTAGDCGFNNLIVYGPGFFKIDTTLTKKFRIGERRSIEFSATALDLLNHPNFRVGGFAADVVTIAAGGSGFGELGNGSAYQDISTTNDLGGRQIDLKLRIIF